MNNKFSRIENLIGKENIKKLKNAHIAIFGLGGVGGYVLEGLVRSGIENFTLFDNDIVEETNLNRQILATNDTLNLFKTDVAKARALSVNEHANIIVNNVFYSKENSHCFDFKNYDFIVDAIDTVTSKLELITKAKDANVPIISCLGTGNKLNPTLLEVTDIYKTSVCPLARVMRCELKKLGIKELKVVYSKEQPIKPIVQNEENGRHSPASAVFVPATAGMIIASEIVKNIINNS